MGQGQQEPGTSLLAQITFARSQSVASYICLYVTCISFLQEMGAGVMLHPNRRPEAAALDALGDRGLKASFPCGVMLYRETEMPRDWKCSHRD